MNDGRAYLQKQLLPELEQAGIHILDYAALNDKQKAKVDEYFDQVVYPVLTPLAVDPGRPFPHISNLSLNLAIMIRDRKGNERFARVKVPDTFPRFTPIKASSGGTRKDGTAPYHHYFVWLEQIIAAHIGKLFPGVEVLEAHPFRVVRDADIDIQELEAMDLLESMEESVRQRRFGTVVKVTVNTAMPAHMRQILIENLEMDYHDLYATDGPLGLSDLMGLYGIDRYDLKDTPFVPALPTPLKGKDLQRRHLRRRPAAGHSAAPSLRLVQTRRRFSARGRGRSRRARHQADPVSRGAQFARGRSACWMPAKTTSKSPCWWN